MCSLAFAAIRGQSGPLHRPGDSMNLTHPFLDIDGDKLREECGIFGVIGAKDAAAMTALGLHALQHRGQEAVGIVSFDGQEFYAQRGIGHVAQVFTGNESFAGLPGSMASGHVRYSTTGGSGLRNVQPLFADLAGRRLFDCTPMAIFPMP